MGNSIGKKGQIAIFIIIGILVVVIIALLYLMRSQLGIDFFQGEGNFIENPEIFIDECIEPYVEEAVGIILRQGGYVEPELFRDFENNKVAFLCYQEDFYHSCINQEPVIFEHLRDEIHEYINFGVNQCFQELEDGVRKSGGGFSNSLLEYEIILEPEKVIVEISTDIDIIKSGQNNKFERLRAVFRHPLYELAVVVQEINKQEAEECEFDSIGYMLFYENIEIDKFRSGDGVKIYTVTDRETDESFRFAVRSCVRPPTIT